MVQNNYAQSMQMPMQQGRQLNVMLVSDMGNIDAYTINPGSSMLFLNESMTEFKMRSRDTNGFPLPERTWTLKETTPAPAKTNFATREEMDAMNAKIDKILDTLTKFAE